MFTGYFRQFAAYNRWANARLHAAAIALPEDVYRQTTGVFFGSLHGTLNHLLLTDRMWLTRLTGERKQSSRLDLIPHDVRKELARARATQDDRWMVRSAQPLLAIRRHWISMVGKRNPMQPIPRMVSFDG